ncbi:MAG TPA: Crp/Fnr family transcriptional regulator [Flavisolibacter sp.]|nr:Crp/Fnr family transcriptional regulator [Flavisolibacter sp.]
MFDLLYQKIKAIVPITEEEFNWSKTLFVPKQLLKRQYLLQQGDVCTYQAFVEKGILWSYTIDEKGSEHILQLASEGWWMADLSSYLTDEPSILNIDAIEAAEVLLISRTSWEMAMQKIPKLEHYFRIIIQNHLIATQKRLLQSFSETAEEKYIRFLHTFPDCEQRVPLHMIASYLGIQRETLSRLRKQINEHK